MKIDWSGRSHNYTEKEIKFLSNVIRTADPLTNGKYQNLFEKSIRTFLGKKNIFVTSSPFLILHNSAINSNDDVADEVIIPAHTYCASAIPFGRNGAQIIWSDIDKKTRVVCVV